MTEDELLSGVTEAMTIAGWRWLHIRRSDRAITMGMRGFPDLIAVPPGVAGWSERALAIELKSNEGRVTTDQAAWLVGLAQAGVTVAVVRPADYDRALRLILDGVSAQSLWRWAWVAEPVDMAGGS